MPAPTGGRPGRPAFRLTSPTSLRRSLRRGIRLSVTCPSRCSASATATIGARAARRLRTGRVVARGSAARIEAGAAKALKLRFTATARKRLRSAHRVKLTLSVRYRDASGATSRSSRKLVLR
jgi:hypothetical protein